MCIRLGRFGTWLPLLVAVAAGGCRETEPPPDYDRDLAEDDTPLMLPGDEWKESAIATGSSEWVPFRPPTAGVAGQPESPDATESPEAGTGTDGGDTIGAEIRDAVADYNEAIADATAEDLLDYFVETQQEAIEPWLAAAVTLTDQLNRVCEALEAGLPDATDRVAQVCETLRTAHSPKLAIESVTVSSETEASGAVKWFGESKTCRLVAVEDEDGEAAWYFELQGLPPYAEKKSTLDAMGAVYERLIQTLESGQPLPQAALDDLERLAPPPATGRDTEDPKPTEPEPDPDEVEPDSVEPKPDAVEEQP